MPTVNMPGPSYRLEAPRPRPPPPPLRFQNSPNASSTLNSDHNPQTLLYDLPSATSISPPLSSSQPKGRVVSPTSPTFQSRSSRGPRSGRPTPPPSAGRNRSVTPLEVAPSELEEFAEHCRAWYIVLVVLIATTNSRLSSQVLQPG